MTHKITFSADVITKATIEEINHIADKLKHLSSDDLMNSASSITYAVDCYDTVMEITL